MRKTLFDKALASSRLSRMLQDLVEQQQELDACSRASCPETEAGLAALRRPARQTVADYRARKLHDDLAKAEQKAAGLGAGSRSRPRSGPSCSA